MVPRLVRLTLDARSELQKNPLPAPLPHIVIVTQTLTLTLSGPVPLRREIRSLQADFPDQWTLYILGLKDFQEVDENDLLSYYQIAGE